MTPCPCRHEAPRRRMTLCRRCPRRLSILGPGPFAARRAGHWLLRPQRPGMRPPLFHPPRRRRTSLRCCPLRPPLKRLQCQHPWQTARRQYANRLPRWRLRILSPCLRLKRCSLRRARLAKLRQRQNLRPLSRFQSRRRHQSPSLRIRTTPRLPKCESKLRRLRKLRNRRRPTMTSTSIRKPTRWRWRRWSSKRRP